MLSVFVFCVLPISKKNVMDQIINPFPIAQDKKKSCTRALPQPYEKNFFLEYPSPTQFGRGKYPSPTNLCLCNPCLNL